MNVAPSQQPPDLTGLIDALLGELSQQPGSHVRSLQRALEVLRGGMRASHAREQLAVLPSLYEQCFLPERETLAVRASASLLVLIDAVEANSEWADVNRAVRTLIEFAGTSTDTVRLTLAEYLSIGSASTRASDEARAACIIGRMMLYGIMLRSLCEDVIKVIEGIRIELGDSGTSIVLVGWSGAERIFWGGPGGLEVVIRQVRDKLRAKDG